MELESICQKEAGKLRSKEVAAGPELEERLSALGESRMLQTCWRSQAAEQNC